MADPTAGAGVVLFEEHATWCEYCHTRSSRVAEVVTAAGAVTVVVCPECKQRECPKCKQPGIGIYALCRCAKDQP